MFKFRHGLEDQSFEPALGPGPWSAALVAARPTLEPDHHYACPICQHGQLETMVMMDAYACNFCRHIFSVDADRQTIQVEDSIQPTRWRWRGRTWQILSPKQRELTLTIWLVCGVIVLIPALLIGLPMQIFPPAANASWGWVPVVWLGLTVVLHSAIALWLLLEHYQLQNYVTWKIRLQDWLEASPEH